jgi:hypothetical protein
MTVNLSPYVNENINDYLLKSYIYPIIFWSHAIGVNPPIILPYYVLMIVNVFYLPWHISQKFFTLKLFYEALYKSINYLIYSLKNFAIDFYNYGSIADFKLIFCIFY